MSPIGKYSCRPSWPSSTTDPAGIQTNLSYDNLGRRTQLTHVSDSTAILIDDLGYVQQSRPEMEVLFTLLSERYERGSVLLTSNLPFSAWESLFKDPMTTAAAIDRLVHHSIILEVNLPSYRMEEAQRSREEGEELQ